MGWATRDWHQLEAKWASLGRPPGSLLRLDAVFLLAFIESLFMENEEVREKLDGWYREVQVASQPVVVSEAERRKAIAELNNIFS